MKSSHLPNSSRRAALSVLVAVTLAGCASQPVPPSEPDALVTEARTTLSNFIRDPDQTWIQDNLSRAKAVLIAPQIVKAGFIVGGSGGRGLLVARDGTSWAGPAFYNLGTASVGFQAGVQVSEYVIVLNTQEAINAFIQGSNFTLGANLSAAVGPVGRAAEASVAPQAAVYTYSRSQGI